MALETDLATLNYAYGGAPFVRLTSPDTYALDVAYGGAVFVAQAEGITACLITITAPTARVKSIDRQFPLVRVEMQGTAVSQEKRTAPPFQYQDPTLIP